MCAMDVDAIVLCHFVKSYELGSRCYLATCICLQCGLREPYVSAKCVVCKLLDLLVSLRTASFDNYLAAITECFI